MAAHCISKGLSYLSSEEARGQEATCPSTGIVTEAQWYVAGPQASYFPDLVSPLSICVECSCSPDPDPRLGDDPQGSPLETRGRQGCANPAHPSWASCETSAPVTRKCHSLFPESQNRRLENCPQFRVSAPLPREAHSSHSGSGGPNWVKAGCWDPETWQREAQQGPPRQQAREKSKNDQIIWKPIMQGLDMQWEGTESSSGT